VNNMKVVDYLVDSLIKLGITDVFGIPGGVVLDFVYALNKRKKNIRTHLLHHEQNAGFAALGYAQATQKMGVAFGTKGPGILNFTTSIAEAYSDSIPSLFITSHSLNDISEKMRFIEDQEIDIVPIFKSITKYCVRVNNVDSFIEELKKSIYLANSGRKGPVVIDISSKIWNSEILENKLEGEIIKNIDNLKNNFEEVILSIEKKLNESKKPLLIIGDGIRQAGIEKEIVEFSEKNKIPVIYSRGCQDVMSNSKMAFGYVGSHGIRYANYILSEADLLISLGNRLSFPIKSKSFLDIFSKCKLIRCDIDENEFMREIPNSENFQCDIKEVLKGLLNKNIENKNIDEWLDKCNKIKEILWNSDTNTPVNEITYLLNNLKNTGAIVGDVGNNEFWLSRAYEFSKNKSKILFSRSLGTMGCSIGKAIGAYYALNKNIICFIGDQGLQMNPQELQFISNNKLPIWIVVINNSSSGMIKSRQIRRYNSEFLLTTKKTGYSVVDLEKLSNTYGFDYIQIESVKDIDNKLRDCDYTKPLFINFIVDENIDLEISLPIGNNCKDMEPKLDKTILERIEKL
jgi:acetolactate synthase, large subunit, biosynthetic type